LLESSRKSKLYSLPEKLIDCETKKFPLLINDEPIKNCHLALVKEKVIDLKAKKLHSDFIYGHDLSSDASELRRILRDSSQQLFGKINFFRKYPVNNLNVPYP
jgi:hypothetical protein